MGICPNCIVYLPRFQNVSVLIAKCSCPNGIIWARTQCLRWSVWFGGEEMQLATCNARGETRCPVLPFSVQTVKCICLTCKMYLSKWQNMSTKSMSVEGMRCKLQRVRRILLPFSTSVHRDPNERMKGRGEMQKKKKMKASFLEMDLIFGPKLNFVKPHCNIGPLLILLAIWWSHYRYFGNAKLRVVSMMVSLSGDVDDIVRCGAEGLFGVLSANLLGSQTGSGAQDWAVHYFYCPPPIATLPRLLCLVCLVHLLLPD